MKDKIRALTHEEETTFINFLNDKMGLFGAEEFTNGFALSVVNDEWIVVNGSTPGSTKSWLYGDIFGFDEGEEDYIKFGI